MSSSIKYYLFAALAAVVLFSLPAHSARRDGLNGNLLIKDHDDVFVYPQKAHSEFNKDRIRVDLADSTSAAFLFTGGAGGCPSATAWWVLPDSALVPTHWRFSQRSSQTHS